MLLAKWIKVNQLIGRLAIVVLAVTVSWSLITYYKQKSLYEIFEYRTSLTSKLAHDLKSPLMAISTSSENLALDPAGEKSTHYAEGILKNVYYMNDLIGDVLQLSVSEGTRVVRNSDEVNLKYQVNAVLEKLEAQIHQKSLLVTVDSFNITSIKSDNKVFGNALSCIVENAVKYAPSGTEIKISGSSGCLIEISNEYEGTITNVGKLTEPFVRGNRARGELEGSGLGLAIAKADFKSLGYKLYIKVDGNVFVVRVMK